MTLDALTDVQLVLVIVVFWAGVCLLAKVIGTWFGRVWNRRAVRRIVKQRLETYCDPATPLEARHTVPAFLREPHVHLGLAPNGSGTTCAVESRVSSGDEQATYGHSTTLIFPAKTREQGQ